VEPTVHLKGCEERSRLFDLLRVATSLYAAMATQLAKEIGTLPKDLYRLRYNAVEEARLLSVQVQEALHAHTNEHGCGSDALSDSELPIDTKQGEQP
jgi:hypothetical protein